MAEQGSGDQKPERKKLRVGQTFKMPPGEPKPKTQLKKASEPFGASKEKVSQAKQAQAESYWDVADDPYSPTGPLQTDFYALHPHHNLHNLDKFGSLMDEIEIAFDEEEFISDPERYMQQLPEEYVSQFEDMYVKSQINEIINDLEEGEVDQENKFEEKMQGCSCCKGFVYKCKGKMCYNLGVCQCMVRTEMEAEAVEHYVVKFKG